MTDEPVTAEVFEYPGVDGTPLLQIKLSNGIVTPPFVRIGDWLRNQMSLDELTSIRPAPLQSAPERARPDAT